MAFMIRDAELADCQNLASLSIQVWLDTYALEGVRSSFSSYIWDCFTQAAFENKLNDTRYKIFVASRDEYLLGYIMLDFESFHKDQSNGFEIARLYVSRHFKGQGIGKTLLNEMIGKCGKKSWLAAYIGNVDAINFYKYLGFEDIDEAIFILDDERVENRILAWK